MPDKPKTLLLISQVYVPDPASVGQHMHDAAAGMVRRGYRVKVYAARRGYDDPSRQYPRRETRDGVEIHRLPLSSFGKSSIAVRLIGGSLFILQAMARGVFTADLKGVLITTSPPMASIAAVFIRFFRRRVGVTFWAMDINPDQMIAMGKISAGSLPARIFDWLNRLILRRADAVVALDRFMADRLERKVRRGDFSRHVPGHAETLEDRLTVLPPWPHNKHLESVPHKDNPFRREHDLRDKFVIMYSGNLSPSHPLTTILEAATRLRDEDRLVFLFIGGGLVKERIEAFAAEHGLSGIRTLPYQPLDKLKYSLSAADVHLVSMGDNMVGIVHPCKGYGALAVGRPILLLGPAKSHIGEIVEQYQVGWRVDHGDVDAAIHAIRGMLRTEDHDLAAMRQRASQTAAKVFNARVMIDRFCDVVESTMR